MPTGPHDHLPSHALALPILAACVLTACQSPPPHHNAGSDAGADTSPAPHSHTWIDLTPHIRIDRDSLTVEFDARVAMDCHNPTTPDVYLELIACSPDTREHESLVVTDATPSLIHAALLTVGLEPGSPANLSAATPPSGGPITVTLITDTNDNTTATPANAWITDATTRTQHPDFTFVFAGSRQARPNAPIAYDADGTGVIVGLTTFGSEVIANTALINPQADIDEPLWIADPRTVPPINTPVRVRLSPATP